VKYVVCVPDGCADIATEMLDGKTPLEAANTPVIDALAARGTVGAAAVIPAGMAPGSDVGNMSILGYNPADFHTGRSPIEAAAVGITLNVDEIAFRCNLVTMQDGVMVDFGGGYPETNAAAEVIEALEAELGGEAHFHTGVQYRHTLVAPRAWLDVDCAPPHDFTGRTVPLPTGPAAQPLIDLMERSRPIVQRYGMDANQIWLWGQGPQPVMKPFAQHYGVAAGMVTAVDLVRGLGRLTAMTIVEVEGANAWYDTNWEGKRDAAIQGLQDGLDLFIIHVEATDEAGHAGNAAAKVQALEDWDQRILKDLVPALDAMGDWRMLVMPDHATPLDLRTHTSQAVPYLLIDSTVDGPGGTYTEAGIDGLVPIPGYHMMGHLLGTS
jgi:2,3-bisphosphoglycerate-independent phosphoglycerate mutase